MAPRHERCQRGTPRLGVRTPIGRYGGALAGMRPHDLAAHVIGELTRRHRDVGWSIVDDVVLGCADQVDEANGNVAWMSALLAGLPGGSGDHDQPLCASGVDAWLRVQVLQTDLTTCHDAVLVVDGLHQPDLLGPASVQWSRTGGEIALAGCAVEVGGVRDADHPASVS
jgi:hypothetical protein